LAASISEAPLVFDKLLFALLLSDKIVAALCYILVFISLTQAAVLMILSWIAFMVAGILATF